MGIKTPLSLDDINEALKDTITFKNIKESTHGATDTVYFCDDKYVLKVYEQSSKKQLSDEIKLHNYLKAYENLKISKLYSYEIFQIKQKPCLLFEKTKGSVVQKVKKTHLEQIAKFLKLFHNKTKGFTNENKNIFNKENLLNLINKTSSKDLLDIYSQIQIEENNDGLIHGDLFIDNAIFFEDKLNAVIDFNEACVGDYRFDLAVVVMSWCDFRKDKFLDEVNFLIENYGDCIIINSLLEYIKYACLYYMTTRKLVNRDFSDLMDKYIFLKDKLYE